MLRLLTLVSDVLDNMYMTKWSQIYSHVSFVQVPTNVDAKVRGWKSRWTRSLHAENLSCSQTSQTGFRSAEWVIFLSFNILSLTRIKSHISIICCFYEALKHLSESRFGLQKIIIPGLMWAERAGVLLRSLLVVHRLSSIVSLMFNSVTILLLPTVSWTRRGSRALHLDSGSGFGKFVSTLFTLSRPHWIEKYKLLLFQGLSDTHSILLILCHFIGWSYVYFFGFGKFGAVNNVVRVANLNTLNCLTLQTVISHYLHNLTNDINLIHWIIPFPVFIYHKNVYMHITCIN